MLDLSEVCPNSGSTEQVASDSRGVSIGRQDSTLINTLLGKVFGTKNEREIKRTMPNVQQISALEPEMKRLSDAELRAKTDEFRARIQERTKDIEDDDERRRVENEVLHEILPEAFAVVREAGRRVLNMRHFDVQLIGGMVLHDGKIA